MAGERLIVSHSMLLGWDSCRFRWYLSYVEGWTPVKQKQVLDQGSIGHELIGIYYNSRIEHSSWPIDDPRHVEAVTRRVHEISVERDVDADLLKSLKTTLWLVKRYIEDFAPFNDLEWEPLEVERHFLIPLVTPKGREVNLQGYVDLILDHRQTRKLWVWDHKFSTRFWSPQQVLMDAQLPTYVYGLRRLGIPIYAFIVNQLNTYSYKDPAKVKVEQLFKREKSYRTDLELANFELEVGRMVDDMVDNFDEPRRSLTRSCSDCAFQNPCLLSMKGIPIRDVMEPEFKRKEDDERWQSRLSTPAMDALRRSAISVPLSR